MKRENIYLISSRRNQGRVALSKIYEYWVTRARSDGAAAAGVSPRVNKLDGKQIIRQGRRRRRR